MEKTNIIQAEDGFVTAIGWLVKFSSPHGVTGVGLVRDIVGDKILIDPDWRTLEWPEDGSGNYWILAPESRRAHRPVDFFGPRDHGISLGCITATKPWTPTYAPATWTERKL